MKRSLFLIGTTTLLLLASCSENKEISLSKNSSFSAISSNISSSKNKQVVTLSFDSGRIVSNNSFLLAVTDDVSSLNYAINNELLMGENGESIYSFRTDRVIREIKVNYSINENQTINIGLITQKGLTIFYDAEKEDNCFTHTFADYISASDIIIKAESKIIITSFVLTID